MPTTDTQGPPLGTLRVLPAAIEHVQAMEAIEKESFPTAWPAESFEREVLENKTARYLVALEGTEVVGYIGSWIILDEVHITTMAVDPRRRSLGLGRRLMAALLDDAIERGARWTVLEVREGNDPAIRMYQAFGFRQVGLRKGYYENGDNALVLWVGGMQNRSFVDLVRGLLGDVVRE